MGYSTDRRGIRSFWPDNSKTEFYKASYAAGTIHELLREAAEHFKTSTYELMEHGSISSDRIHTDCLGYDLYDASDYTDFILITYERS